MVSMECNNIITRLLGIKGWEVKGLSIEDRKGTATILFGIKFDYSKGGGL